MPPSEIWVDVARALNLDAAQLDACRRDFWAGDKLDTALITDPKARDKKLVKKLDAVAGRVLKRKVVGK